MCQLDPFSERPISDTAVLSYIYNATAIQVIFICVNKRTVMSYIHIFPRKTFHQNNRHISKSGIITYRPLSELPQNAKFM